MLKADEKEGRAFLAGGFEKLQCSFADPHKYTSEGIVISLGPRHPVRKRYGHNNLLYDYFGSNKNALYFSKVELKEKHFEVIAFNRVLTSDTAYQQLNKSFYELLKALSDTVGTAVGEDKN